MNEFRVIEEYISDVLLYVLYKNKDIILMTNSYETAQRELNKRLI